MSDLLSSFWGKSEKKKAGGGGSTGSVTTPFRRRKYPGTQAAILSYRHRLPPGETCRHRSAIWQFAGL
jgi:hypothetical protein